MTKYHEPRRTGRKKHQIRHFLKIQVIFWPPHDSEKYSDAKNMEGERLDRASKKQMKRAVKYVVSILLAIVCLFSYTLWDTAYALSNELRYQAYIRNIAGEIAEEPAETLPYSPLLYEDVSGREENIKRFVREDRAVEAVVYPYPVHYQENGEWKDIDNRLVLETQPDGTQVYTCLLYTSDAADEL